ncbi:uncharacterized protein [Physcomitrium patens]|uniref:uncharacterized protein isoform X2 n=1 Tax=Physcomitrium patens TaxID=3218 RepID=UPI000D16F346|nr:splicing factor-like protein 1 isoform X2 [Physcomitrium patens]|eukprot:XP_024357397.1 splicing factor-like protein 1 isoform X2 [Physcomitrella patens]
MPGIGGTSFEQTRAEQIATQLDSSFWDIEALDGPRSPSPPPIYDSNGQRTNTREGRRREQLEIERREAIGECMKLNPLYKPPVGYKPVYKEAKLFIPVKKYPGYNFIGLILGPRGNTQKRMEQETGTKIAIRGRGAVKEGKRLISGRRDKDLESVHDDLHVHITADCFEKVDAAVALIEPLLTPVDEIQNMHKRKQLRELAEMNGTMRDFPKICSICGEVGHQEWQCSKEALITFQSKVACSICGNGGHPSIDCLQKTSKPGTTQGQTLDTEYMNFLKELNNGSLGFVTNVSNSSTTTNTSVPGLASTDAPQNSNEIQSIHKQFLMPNSATASPPQLLPPTMLNRPQVVYIRSPPVWGGACYNGGLQPRGPPTKLIRIANGGCVQQRPMCMAPIQNGPCGATPRNDTKNPNNSSQPPQLETPITYVSNPSLTIGSNQNGPLVPYNSVKMVGSPNLVAIHPHQMMRPIYQTTMHAPTNPPSQSMEGQPFQIIHGPPPKGMMNSLNVVHAQIVRPHQTNDYRILQRPLLYQPPLHGAFKPNSLQTPICASPQSVAPNMGTLQQFPDLSTSQMPPQSWQPVNSNNTQLWPINQNKAPPLPPTFHSGSSLIDSPTPKSSIKLVSQVSTIPNPSSTQNLVSTIKSTSHDIQYQPPNTAHHPSNEESASIPNAMPHDPILNSSRQTFTQQLNSSCFPQPPSSSMHTQSIDFENEKLMASVETTQIQS